MIKRLTMKKILIQTIFLSFCLLSGVTYGQSGTLYLASAMGWTI